MKTSKQIQSCVADISNKLDLLGHSFSFLQRHLLTVLCLAIIAALGRVVQLGGFGEIPSWLNILLEFVVEGSRLAIFILVIGIEQVRKLPVFLRQYFGSWKKLREGCRRAVTTIRSSWIKVVFNVGAFLIIAGFLNFLIDQLAYETCLLLSLKQEGILVPASSEWTILLFFKNILVIPFTIVFETVLLMWILRRPALA